MGGKKSTRQSRGQQEASASADLPLGSAPLPRCGGRVDYVVCIVKYTMSCLYLILSILNK